VNRLKRLMTSYGKYIAIPWRNDAAAAQRVIFCVYNEADELRLLAKIDEFEIATRQAGHDWAVFDLTDRVQSTSDVRTTLDNCALSMFADRVAAMSSRFDNVASGAAEQCEPQVQFIQVPRRTLKTDGEIDAWVDEVKQQLKAALQNGPIVIR
jgi:hypothetical protein